MKNRAVKCCAVLCAAVFAFSCDAWAEESQWGVAQSAGEDRALYLTDGQVVLSSSDLPEGTTNILFTVAEADVKRISLDGSGGQAFTFTPKDGGTTLTAVGTNSMFRLRGDVRWSFADGFEFVGLGEDSEDELQPLPYHGAAIDCEGGRLLLFGTSFEGFVSRLTGGAISARMLVGDMVVSNCTFAGNMSHPINGYGGAIYASADETAGAAVALRITDSRFEENYAQNGGAICTFHMVRDEETAVKLVVNAGTTFVGNVADYEGGAIFNEREMEVIGAEGNPVVFERNEAGFTGGAIAANDVVAYFEPAKLTISNAVVFVSNVASNDNSNVWKAGGAISVMIGGYELEVWGAAFTNNLAYAKGIGALGGAIYAERDVTNTIVRTSFSGNDAVLEGGSDWSYGGAVSVAGGLTTVDTCVFDCAPNADCSGDGIDFNAVRGLLKNCTFRRGANEAVSVYAGNLSVTNCVLVGNRASGDLYADGAAAIDMAYTAYGKLELDTGVTLTTAYCLPDRDAGIYDGDSLRLDGSGFNPVAGLGLEQPGVTDFVEVGYGTKMSGSSMGAYETPTEKRVLDVYATREYDGTPKSNNCEWAWSILDTNYAASAYADLVPATVENTNNWLKACFAFDAETEWTFGPAAGDAPAGHYDSTNAVDSAWHLTAKVNPVGATNVWLATLLAYRYEGDITPSKEVAVILEPTDYPWTGSGVEPFDGGLRGIDGSNITVVVSNKLTGAVSRELIYEVGYDQNVSPTDQAKFIVTITNGTFVGTVLTNHFFITAYRTEYYENGAQGETTTNGCLSASNACAVVSVPQGCCLDWQNSQTNATVYLFGRGGPADPYVTTLVVRYEKDVNVPGGDGIPDKYQKKLLFATVNGYWNGTRNGDDRVVWVTLTNATVRADGAGTWDAGGSCLLTDALVPAVGESPLKNFKMTGVWNQTPVGQVVDNETVPIFFYSPDAEEDPGRDPGRPRKLLSAASGKIASVVPKNALAITDFRIVDGRAMAAAVDAQVMDETTGAVLRSMPLGKARVSLLGAATPDGDFRKLTDAETDEDGVFGADRLRNARFFKVTLEQ